MSYSSSSSSLLPQTLKVGIVGFGTFGQFLVKTMIKQGLTIRATSRTDHYHLSHQLGVSFFGDVVSFLEADNDVILLSTSILSLSEVLRSMPLHCLKRRTLFVDVLSVKEHPRNLLLQVLPEEMMCSALVPCLDLKVGKTDGSMNTKSFETLVKLKESTTSDSFDLFSGVFIHKRFAPQELKNLEHSFEMSSKGC